MFEWSSKYEFGIPEIDKQHRYLFELGNDFFASDYKTGRPLMLALFKYTRVHFELEEEYMKRMNYSDIETHREIHTKLLRQLTELAERGINSEEDFKELQLFIWTWITNHIMQVDINYKNNTPIEFL